MYEGQRKRREQKMFCCCASIWHLGCMNMLACACTRGPVSMRCRSSETDYKYGYRHKCIYSCLLTANKFFVFVFLTIFYWCNLLINVVSMIINCKVSLISFMWKDFKQKRKKKKTFYCTEERWATVTVSWRRDTYPEKLLAQFHHEVIGLGFVFVVQGVQVEVCFL